MTNNRSEWWKQRLTFAAIGLAYLPFALLVDRPKSFTWLDLSLYFGLLLGFAGIIVLLTQFFLGSRAVTGLLYRDIPWTMRIHKNMGTYGTLLIFAHPILMLYPYAQNVWYIFKPTFGHSAFETSVTWGRLALYALIIIWITSALVRRRIKYRPWRYTHYLGQVVLPLALIHSPPIGRTLTYHPALVYYWYFLTLVYLTMLAIRLRFYFTFGKQQYKVLTTNHVGNDVTVLQLQAVGPLMKRLQVIQPGQYVYVQRALISEEHPFSVVDYDTAEGKLLLAFKHVGSYTEKLSRLQPDDMVLVDGPYGRFTDEIDSQPAARRVFIAGGIGITPFVRRILQAPAETEQFLFYANREMASGTFRDQLRQKLGAYYIDVLSQELGAPGLNVETGHISKDIIAKYIQIPSSYQYFICGPTAMMDAAAAELKSLGVPEQNIHSEVFGF